MNNIIAPLIPADMFQWHLNTDDTYFGTADASALGFRPGWSPFYRLYNDSCDVGFLLVNPKTFTEMIFVLEHIHDEYDSWEFKSIKPGKNGKYIKLIVFND